MLRLARSARESIRPESGPMPARSSPPIFTGPRSPTVWISPLSLPLPPWMEPPMVQPQRGRRPWRVTPLPAPEPPAMPWPIFTAPIAPTAVAVDGAAL